MDILTSIEKEMKKLYPSWNKLSEDDKKIVSNIAMQIPISCEDVATIFLLHGGSNVEATIEYIEKQYGFVIDRNLGKG